MDKYILIVDDSVAVRQMVGAVLGQAGYKLIEAENGIDALEKLDGRQVDLIICDVNMPQMDGIAFLHTVKNDKAYLSYKFIMIIMLTIDSTPETIESVKHEGAKAWLEKPFNPEELLDVVGKFIN